ncbi:LuxR family transcriptional regulator [Pantoea sp. YU22]|uniref:helix-turn-helix transcriptional regulator n=1 Tax=Pantoea TaxID=53335 RepID=UPI000F898218|nr:MULTISPECIES: helix-turn-helix transcriptional regulator [Pantoea]RTY58251.1 LuxR family transcriptional regulator [Pantoea sp. YU22]WBV24054.1 helix-turn-helix transcriptional regulator [Pantoea piersonii]
MDIKVICTDENYYFRLGISKIIEEALLLGGSVAFLPGFDSENLRKADIILVSVSQWRLFMCQPAYRFRKPGSILLVFVNHIENIISDQLPVCYQSLTLISRSDAVRSIRDKITKAWLIARDQKTNAFAPTDCMRCNYARISLIQLQVMSFLKSGCSVNQTAKSLGLSVKTIYAHKYNVMRKFDLKGDCDFYSFLSDLSLLDLYKGVIGEKENFRREKYIIPCHQQSCQE